MKIRARRRTLVFLALGLLVLVATWAIIDLRLSRPIGSGPAGPMLDAADFQSVWSERPIQVVGIGDSVTAGLGANSPDHSYFNRVIQNPKDEFEQMRGVCLSAVLPNLSSDNYAISGTESDTHWDIIQNKIPVYEDRFGIVLMTSGGNDLIHSYGRSAPRECAMYSATLAQAQPWIRNFQARLDAMVQAINDKFPAGCEIYIGDIYDPTDGVGDALSIFLPDWPDGLAIHAQYNEAIRSVAEKHDFVFVVPLHRTFLGHGSHCRQFWRSTYDRNDPHYWYYDNIEDPNDRGYDAIRRIFLDTIARNTILRRAPLDTLAPASP